ncbi:MAG: uncharacterized protein KVP18_004838 [Porospora cf. gigantea A]|uniref:uncharacterized protein n=1 Tax=Porospora cf. gigantea A TaxID=2853593 RepID=UPI003559B61A|nr:MAG: hypothetical protein KVP18_004838 [Porospora cf. gigantea A]
MRVINAFLYINVLGRLSNSDSKSKLVPIQDSVAFKCTCKDGSKSCCDDLKILTKNLPGEVKIQMEN